MCIWKQKRRGGTQQEEQDTRGIQAHKQLGTRPQNERSTTYQNIRLRTNTESFQTKVLVIISFFHQNLCHHFTARNQGNQYSTNNTLQAMTQRPYFCLYPVSLSFMQREV